MKLRTHTIPLPTDYVSELRNSAQRKKSRCFIEYFYDMEVGEHNSYGFYAKSWDVGKGTAHRWVKEFNEALEIFDAARELKRQTHYKKAVEKDDVFLCPKSNGTNGTILMERMERNQEPMKSSVLKSSGTNGTIDVEQSFININNKENETPFLDKEFLRFINEIKLSIKNVGNSTSIYKSYSKVQHLLDLKTLSKIYRLYSQETNESNKVGLSKFLDDYMFLSYVQPVIKINLETEIIEGTYDKEKEILNTNNRSLQLTFDRYSELNLSNCIQTIRYIA